MTISKQQAATIAAAVRPQIKAYISANRDKYERFLQAEREQSGHRTMLGENARR